MVIQQSIAVKFPELHPYAHFLSFYYPVIPFSFLFALSDVSCPLYSCVYIAQCWSRKIRAMLVSPFIVTIPAWARPSSSSYFSLARLGITLSKCSNPALGFLFPSLWEAYVCILQTSAAIHAYLPRPVEIIGYIGRAASSKQSPNWTLGPYLVQTLFLLLAPALLAASIYMFLGRIILVLQAESHALMKKKWSTKVFVTGDVLSFVLQGAGELNNPQMR
jgi:hypothetical protein